MPSPTGSSPTLPSLPSSPPVPATSPSAAPTSPPPVPTTSATRTTPAASLASGSPPRPMPATTMRRKRRRRRPRPTARSAGVRSTRLRLHRCSSCHLGSSLQTLTMIPRLATRNINVDGRFVRSGVNEKRLRGRCTASTWEASWHCLREKRMGRVAEAAFGRPPAPRVWLFRLSF